MKNNATVFSANDTAITAAKFAIVPKPKNNPMADESDNPLGEYVRQVMKENGLSAEAVSKLAARRGGEIGRSTIQQIVQGKTGNPGILTLRDLAWGINRPLEVLLSKVLGKQLGEVQMPNEFVVLADLYQQLSLAEQRGMKRYYIQAMEREMRRILTQLAESE